MLAEEHFDVYAKGGYPLRSGNSHDRLVPFGVYPTSDGHVAIVAFSPEAMKGLLDAMDQPHLIDDPRFASRGPRMKHANEFNAIVEKWTSAHTSAEVEHELLTKRGVPCAPVRRADEALHDERLHESGALVRLEHPSLGGMEAVGIGLPIQFSATPVRFDRPAMPLGGANEEIYGGMLGMSQEAIASLRAAGHLSRPPSRDKHTLEPDMKVLEGIKVLDLGRYIAGPYCAALLSQDSARTSSASTG
jgi:formyl-CoA transferase